MNLTKTRSHKAMRKHLFANDCTAER